MLRTVGVAVPQGDDVIRVVDDLLVAFQGRGLAVAAVVGQELREWQPMDVSESRLRAGISLR